MILQIPADVTPSCRRRRRPAGRSLTGPSWRSLVSPTIEPRRRRWSLLKAGRNLKLYFSFSPVIYFTYNRTKLHLLHPQNNQSRLLALARKQCLPRKRCLAATGACLSPLCSSPSGRVRSLSSSLWTLSHLTALHINDNNLSRIPPDIAKLPHLAYLNLSSNKLRSLPAELGNVVSLRYLTPENPPEV